MLFVKERRQKTEKKIIKTFFSSNTENMEHHSENSANDQWKTRNGSEDICKETI